MGKCALIVDDSRTSRAVLQRILETHELAVDTAESAEVALEYLVENRPDVIFMDHLMPGMDGFEAVTAIKRNPVTATIPIMMYTSQKGDVYVGQARALGAVGVLPKEIEPVEVSKILESLHIVGDAPAGDGQAAAEPPSTDEYPMLANLDQDMRLMLEDLFDQQRAILKRDLLKSSDRIADKVADRIRVAEYDEEPDAAANPPLFPSKLLVATGVLALIAGTLAVALFALNARFERLVEENTALADVLSRESTRMVGVENERLLELQAFDNAISDARRASLQAMEWGLNTSLRYPFGEPALGDDKVATFEALVAQLLSIGFSGEVIVDVHSGLHCLSIGANGYTLADPQTAASACDLRGLVADAEFDVGRQQSVAMAALFNNAEARSNGAVRFVIASQGSADPGVEYPLDPATVFAGEWNAIADANHRISVRFAPDAGVR